MRRGSEITAALLLVPVLVGVTGLGAARADEDRCTSAAKPSDRVSLDECDSCPRPGPDGAFRLLDRAADAARVPMENRKLGALAEKAVKDAVEKGYDVGTHWDLAGYGIVGVDTGLAALLDDKQTDLQKAAAADGAIWLRHTVKAQAGVNLGAAVPVGPDGFYVRTGASAGANLAITVDKQYDRRLAALAKNAALNQLTVPYAAIDAVSMKPGERVTIAGDGNVAVSAGTGYGANTDTVIPRVSVGASAESGVTRVLSGRFATEVTREAGNQVRVTLRTDHGGNTTENLRLFGGVSVNRDGLEIPVSTGVNVVDAALSRGLTSVARSAAHEAEKVLSAEFVTAHGDLTNDGDLQEYTFDLSRREARRAYEHALAGDFRPAAELAGCDGGVGFSREVNDKVKTAFDNTKLQISLLKYSVNSSSTNDLRTIRDGAGTRSFDLFSYSYDRRGFTGSHARVDVGTVAALSGVLGADGKSVHLTYRGDMENRFWTSSGEMKDLVHLGTSMAGGDLAATTAMNGILNSGRAGINLPSFLNYYGRTKMLLDLTISKSGVDRIAKATDEDLWAAFAGAHRETPEWATPEGRAKMEEYERFGRGGGPRSDNSSRYISERYWAGSYERSREAIADLGKLRTAGSDAERAQLLRDAAEAMGDDFTAGAALANLSGERSRAVKFGIQNDNVDYTWTQVGEDSAIIAVQ